MSSGVRLRIPNMAIFLVKRGMKLAGTLMQVMNSKHPNLAYCVNCPVMDISKNLEENNIAAYVRQIMDAYLEDL